MYYERSLTNLALALLPTFAALLTVERRTNGEEMLPGGAMSELIGRINSLQLITKDQIMNLAAELLPMGHLGVLVGFQEWDQIRYRRRRAIGDLIMAYLTTTRTDLVALERETHLVSYACRYLSDPLRTSFLEEARYEAAWKSLLEMGYTAFPRQDPGCAGSFQDLNEHRISVPVTQALQSGLAEVEAATSATAQALMETFLWSRRGPNEEDLMDLLSPPTNSAGSGGWFRFPFRSPLQAPQLGRAYHGTHMECLHGLIAIGRIMPSNDKVAGMRHFDNRQGVYLHKESNKHLAQGYAAFIRYGPKHVYLRALCEVEVDPTGSAKKGKKTNQMIFSYESVRICAFHLQVATKSELQLGDYLREWASALEVPLSIALAVFQAIGLDPGLKKEGGEPQGGVTPHGAQGGDAPPEPSTSPNAPEALEVEQDEDFTMVG
eukprot:s1667_g27.t1